MYADKTKFQNGELVGYRIEYLTTNAKCLHRKKYKINLL